MKELFRIILGLFLVYLLINWAADNPNSVRKLRTDIQTAATSIVTYVGSLSDKDEG